jgi:glycosyltransferase involved in cell wall biosynthesis
VSEMRHPLRILQVSTSDLGGGAEGSAWNLFQAYRQCGFDSWLAVGRKFRDDPNALVISNKANRSIWTRLWRQIRARGTGTSLEQLTRLLGKLAWLGEPRRLAECYRGIEDFHYPGTWRLLDLPPRRPTLIHCHNLHSNYFDLRVLPSLSQQVPVVLNVRDEWLLTGHCAYSLGCERWKTGCGRCPNLTIYPSVRRDGTAYNWRRKRDIYARSRLYITAPSRWLMDRVQESMLRGVQYQMIPNAIDLAIFHPGNRNAARCNLGLPLNARIVLLTAHSTFKDLATMEAALARINRPTASEDLLFICLGRNGSEQPLGQGLFRYAGFERDKQRMALYYQASDVYIHAALGEAFGKTIAEAMACGTSVVATAVGGIPEQIEDGVTGFLVPPFDVESMSRAIERLFVNENVRKQMAESAATHARKRFGLDRQVADFLEWYEEILQDWSQWKCNALSNPD